jgi:hypothetical protein
MEPHIVRDEDEKTEKTEKIFYPECLELLGSQSVGRIAVIADGHVDIFPVNYGLDGDGIIFRTNLGTKTRGALAGEVVFEVDVVEPDEQRGWSVVVRGIAEDITHFDGPQLADRIQQSWAGPKQCLLRITPTTITGRRVGAPAGVAGQSASADA